MLAYRLLMIFVLIYVGHFNPAHSPTGRFLDVVQEFLLLTQASLMPIYTEFVPHPDVRYQVGWISAGLLLTQVALSLIVILADTTYQIKLRIRRCCNKRKAKA